MVVGHPRARYAIPTAVVVLLLGDAMQTAARRARPRAASTSPSLLGCDASRSSSLDEHLSELPMLGMHVLRARDGAGCDGSGGDDAALLDVYVDGLQKDLFVREDYSRAAPNLELACPGGPQSSAAVSARAWLLRPLQRIVGRHRPRLVDRLVQQKKRLTQQAARELLNSTAAPDSDAALRRWKVFTPHGDGVTLARKTILQALAECDTLYVFEGGRFAWPGVSVGFKRTITLRADDAIAVATTFSLMPLVLSVEGLLTHAECDQIIAEAEPHMVASPVSKHAGERPGNDPGNATEDSWQELSLVRTSSQTRVPPGGDKTCLTLDRRAHRVLRVPDSHGEPLQVLRYHEAEFYDVHLDYFDPQHFSDRHIGEFGGSNRFATVLSYLTGDPEADQGGQTHFPRVGGAPLRSVKCTPNSPGLKVRPKKSDTVIFYSQRPDGNVDPLSAHAGCAPLAGFTKWAVNKWVWSEEYGQPLFDPYGNPLGVEPSTMPHKAEL